MSSLTEFLFPRGAKSAFALAVIFGGALGCLAPESFTWFFGWHGGGSSYFSLSILGLGIVCAGWLLYSYWRWLDGAIAISEAVTIAGSGAAIEFLVNFKMGYPLGMFLLIIFSVSVAVVGSVMGFAMTSNTNSR